MAKEYSELLKSPKWQKKRLEILNRDKFTCKLCGDTETSLHVHHAAYKGMPWDIDSEQLCTVCADCHSAIHELKEHQILKVVKRLSPDASWLDMYAFTLNCVAILYHMYGSPVTVQIILPYDTLNFIHEHKIVA